MSCYPSLGQIYNCITVLRSFKNSVLFQPSCDFQGQFDLVNIYYLLFCQLVSFKCKHLKDNAVDFYTVQLLTET